MRRPVEGVRGRIGWLQPTQSILLLPHPLIQFCPRAHGDALTNADFESQHFFFRCHLSIRRASTFSRCCRRNCSQRIRVSFSIASGPTPVRCVKTSVKRDHSPSPSRVSAGSALQSDANTSPAACLCDYPDPPRPSRRGVFRSSLNRGDNLIVPTTVFLSFKRQRASGSQSG